MRLLFKRLGTIVFWATLLFGICGPAKAQVANPANLNALLCNGPVGAIAMRYPDRWRCLPPGAAGQLFQSGGPNTVGGWFTPSGTGNVQTDGNAAANAMPYFSAGTTLAYDPPGGTPLDRLLGLTSSSPAGYLKRTGTGAYVEQAIPASDLPVFAAANVPAFTGQDCSIAAGTLAINCAGFLSTSHTFTAQQNFLAGYSYFKGGGTGVYPLDVGGASTLGWNFGNNTETDFWETWSGSGNLPIAFSWYQLTGTGTATKFMDVGFAGLAVHVPLKPDAPLGVAYGGTGQTAGGGAALDAIDNFNAVYGNGGGIMYRNGGNSYSLTSQTSLLDGSFSSVQGSILYRGASGWAALPSGASGQFLGANGGGANPSWQSPSAPPAGSRNLLSTYTANNTNSWADTSDFTNNYSEYEVDFEKVVPAANCTLGFNVAVGGTFQSTNTISQNNSIIYYGSNPYGQTYSGAGVFLFVDTNGPLVTNSPGATGRIFFSRPTASTPYQVFRYEVNYYGSNNAFFTVTGSGYVASAGQVTGLEMGCGATPYFQTGIIKVYGSN